jgi:hypothetical protein
MAQAFKKYILIDHTNNRSIFINNTSELTAWFATFNIVMANIAVDANGVPTGLTLLDTSTGAAVPIKKITNATSICIQ